MTAPKTTAERPARRYRADLDANTREHLDRLQFREASIRLVPATRDEGTTCPDCGVEMGDATTCPECGKQRSAASGETTVEIAMSSEAPAERWDWRSGDIYDEILGHGAGEVDLTYAKDGLPFFADHESRRMVGLIDTVTLDADGVLRGTVRFGAHPDASWVSADMLSGIRKKISIGYDPGETYTQAKDGERVVRRYTGWRLYEASSVPIPADYTVGVGRSARPGAPSESTHQGEPHKGKEITVPEVIPGSGAPDGAAVRAEVAGEFTRIAELATLHKMQDKLPDWISNHRTEAQVREEILAAYRTKTEATMLRGGDEGVVQLSANEAKQYSVARAIKGLINNQRTGLEFEISDAVEKKLGRQRTSPMSFYMPTNMPRGERAGLAVASSGAGQELKFTEYGGFLGILRNRMLAAKLGARVLTGLQGDLGFVTQPSANTFAWGAETGTTSATNFGTSLRTMAPKVGAAKTQYTRQMLAQSVESIEGLVRDDLDKIVALALDKAAFQGTGANSQPTGVLYTTGIGAVTMGANGAAISSIGKLIDLWTEVAGDNADIGKLGYASTPQIAGLLAQTQLFSGTNGMPILSFEGAEEGFGRVNGLRFGYTNQMPSTLTKGTASGVCHAVAFGNWDDLLIGEWGAAEVIVDPYTVAPQQIVVSVLVLADVFLRYVESFAAIQDARLS